MSFDIGINTNFNSLQLINSISLIIRFIRLYLIYLSIVLIVGKVPLYGQNHVFKHFTVDEGLPSSEVYNIYQTKEGHILLASDRGVSFFDGYEFENYSLQDGLPDNTVFAMYEDAKRDELWFYTFSGEIFSYSKSEFQVLPELSDLNKELTYPRQINSIYVDKQGIMWLTLNSYKNGFIRIHEKKNVETGYLLNITSRFQTLFIGGNEYTVAMNEEGDEWSVILKDGIKIDLTNIIEQESFIEPVLKMIESDSSIYLQFLNGILQVNKTDKSYKSLYTNSRQPPGHMYLDNSDNLWVGLMKGGVLKFSKADLEKNTFRLLEGESVTSILHDSQGGYWFTTLDNGIFYMPWEEFYNYDEDEKLCKTITMHNDDLWAGYAHGEIRQYNKNNTSKKYKLPGENRYNTVQSIVSISDRIYANCSNGLYEIIDHTAIRSNHKVYSRKLTKNKDVLWALGNGFYSFKNDEMLYSSSENKFKKWTTAICQRLDSTYLIGTFEGVWNFDGEKIEPNNYENEILNERISDIKLMKDVTIFATIGNGLLLEASDHIYHLKKKDKGLLSNVCNSIYVENDSVFWVSTNEGINKITWRNNEDAVPSYTINGITKEDGLRSAEVHQVLIEDSYLWAATNKGLIKFDKRILSSNENKIPVYLKSVEVADQKMNLDKKFEIPYSENNIEIEYVALSYKNKERITYRYKLHQKDNWIYTKNRSLRLSSLSDNDYSFTLEASIDNTTWTRADKVLKFTIHPPLWKSNWFQLLYVLVGGGLVFIFYYLRMNALKKETELRKKSLKSEYKALKAQLNPHFMFNSLNSINSFILSNDRFIASKYLTKFSRLMRLTLNNSAQSFISLDKEIETLTLYIEMEALRVEHKFEFTIECDEKIIPENYRVSPMLIQPFIENAIWHGVMPLKSKKGKISIEFKYHSQKGIECVVKDNGIGRTKSLALKEEKGKALHKSRGISIINQRLEAISSFKGQEYSANISDGDTGTIVRIIMPAKIITYGENSID